MGRWLPVATPRLGQRRRTQTAKLGCGNNNRACPMIPSARNREVWGLLAAEPAFAFAGTRSQSVAVRSGGYEPPFCQYGGWTVAAVRKTDNLLCVCTHDLALERKNAIRIERKSQAFLICNLVFGNFGNPRIVCGAANLQGGVECIHNLQNAVHHQIPRRFFFHKKSLNPHNNCVFKLIHI